MTVKSDQNHGSTHFLTLYSSVSVSSNVGPELLTYLRRDKSVWRLLVSRNSNKAVV